MVLLSKCSKGFSGADQQPWSQLKLSLNRRADPVSAWVWKPKSLENRELRSTHTSPKIDLVLLKFNSAYFILTGVLTSFCTSIFTKYLVSLEVSLEVFLKGRSQPDWLGWLKQVLK